MISRENLSAVSMYRRYFTSSLKNLKFKICQDKNVVKNNCNTFFMSTNNSTLRSNFITKTNAHHWTSTSLNSYETIVMMYII